MSLVAVLRVPINVDLASFIALLRRLRVPHRVSEEAGQQVLWVPGDELAEQVRGLYERYPEGDGAETVMLPPKSSSATGFVAQLRASPLTAVILLLTLLVAALSLLGDNLAVVNWLSFQPFRVEGDYLYFASLASALDAGQWWRLVTPMLIHFGWLHLAMNAMWYWELGRRIEAQQGWLALLGLTLWFSLLADLTQYFASGPSLFGGLSGVLYGLLGHCWLYQKLAPNTRYQLPPGVAVMMLVWLLLCLSGLITAFGFGAIANGAHVGGLLAGCLTGVLGGALARRRT